MEIEVCNYKIARHVYFDKFEAIEIFAEENFLKWLQDQSIACEVKFRKPQRIDDAIEWFKLHECGKGNIFQKRAKLRQIENEEQYEHTERIEENEIRKVIL